MRIKKHPTIYLDYASSTPIDKKVLKLINFYNNNFYANATSIHKEGVKARLVIEKARGIIAKELNAHKDEIIFTGSSTESNAMVIIGIVNNFLLNNKGIIPHIITTEIEHPAVLLNFKNLEEKRLSEVTYIKINEYGFVNPKDIKDNIKENTILVSVMYANNEIGSIQPIQEIAKNIRHYKKDNLNKKIYPLFHTDATQAMNYLYTANVEKLGIDLMSFNGSKIYGPKGVGVLYKKRNIKLSPIYSGGDQEFGLRSGTENVSSIAGLALALEITNKIKDKEIIRLSNLRDYAIRKLVSINNSEFEIVLNGDINNRLPNNINISVKGLNSDLLVIELDARGILVSSKSACKSTDENESYVVRALQIAKKHNKKEIDGSIRITLGRETKKIDLDIFISNIKEILEKYKEWK